MLGHVRDEPADRLAGAAVANVERHGRAFGEPGDICRTGDRDQAFRAKLAPGVGLLSGKPDPARPPVGVFLVERYRRGER